MLTTFCHVTSVLLNLGVETCLELNASIGDIYCRKTVKPTAPPSQLTIFYAGAVNVYDDVSPEKVLSLSFSLVAYTLALLS